MALACARSAWTMTTSTWSAPRRRPQARPAPVRLRVGARTTHRRESDSGQDAVVQRAQGPLPKPEDVDPRWLARANDLKSEYLTTHPGFDPGVAAYWAKYQQIFSCDGLWRCDPADLKRFANSDVGANPGNQATFESAWNDLRQEAAAESTRQTIEYLLYGPATVPLEDRLQHLLSGTKRSR